MQILLVSTYELGHQPLALASAAAALRAAGHEVRCLDLSVEEPDGEALARAGLIAFSVPMHTAARLGITVARRARLLNPAAHLSFFGLYASPLHDLLLEDGIADSVAAGDAERSLPALAAALEAGLPLENGLPAGGEPLPLFERGPYPLPDRTGLPPLAAYAGAWDGNELRPAGYVEASRGCAHRCTHCPLTPVFGGRLRLVAAETVLADVEQLVELGARHITFGDPDFLNAVPHSLAIVAALHERWPELSFDATIKVEHLIEHAAVLPRLRAAGCLFVTSAFESCNDEVLGLLEKGHTLLDMERAVALARQTGLVLRPTWVAFTPWGSAADFLGMLRFVEAQGLVANVQPVQYTLRLLLPPGSPLVPVLDRQGLLGELDPAALTYAWHNPDPLIDPLQREVAAIVERAPACDEQGNVDTFAEVKAAALRLVLGRDGPAAVLPQPALRVPGLTEAWFCCAEPTTRQVALMAMPGFD